MSELIADNESMLSVRAKLNTMQLTLFDILKITTTTSAIASGAVTSIDIEAVGEALLSDDDDLVLVDPTGMTYHNLKVAAACDGDDTTLTIDSYTFNSDMPSGCYICLTAKELLSIIR